MFWLEVNFATETGRKGSTNRTRIRLLIKRATLSHNTKSAFMMPLVELSDVDPSYKPRVLRAVKPSPALPARGREIRMPESKFNKDVRPEPPDFTRYFKRGDLCHES